MVTSASQACREAGTKPSAQVPAGVWHVVGAQCRPAPLTRDAGGTAHQTTPHVGGHDCVRALEPAKGWGASPPGWRLVRCAVATRSPGWSPGSVESWPQGSEGLTVLAQPHQSACSFLEPRSVRPGGSAHNPPRRVAARGTLSNRRSQPPTHSRQDAANVTSMGTGASVQSNCKAPSAGPHLHGLTLSWPVLGPPELPASPRAAVRARSPLTCLPSPRPGPRPRGWKADRESFRCHTFPLAAACGQTALVPPLAPDPGNTVCFTFSSRDTCLVCRNGFREAQRPGSCPRPSPPLRGGPGVQ